MRRLELELKLLQQQRDSHKQPQAAEASMIRLGAPQQHHQQPLLQQPQVSGGAPTASGDSRVSKSPNIYGGKGGRLCMCGPLWGMGVYRCVNEAA